MVASVLIPVRRCCRRYNITILSYRISDHGYICDLASVIRAIQYTYYNAAKRSDTRLQRNNEGSFKT